jgi:hypothetical protein
VTGVTEMDRQNATIPIVEMATTSLVIRRIVPVRESLQTITPFNIAVETTQSFIFQDRLN